MAAVVGVGRSRVFRHDDVPLGVLGVEACREAIEASGLSVSDIDGLCCVPDQPFAGVGSLDGINLVGNRFIASALGIQPSWAFDCSGLLGHSLVSAVAAVEAGLCQTALVFRGMHSPSGSYGHTSPREVGGQEQFVAPYGAFFPAMFAQLWQRYRALHGTGTRAQMARFVTESRRNALKNPKTYWASHNAKELSVEDYLDGRQVSEPFSIFDCDLPIQVAGAFVITSDDRASHLDRPAYIRGMAWNQPGQFVGSMVPTLEKGRVVGSHLADRFWKSARFSRSDVRAVELYDGFSIFAPLWAETLGFCEEGEGFEFLEEVAMSAPGPLVANTSGGSLGGGRLHGIAQYSEAALQVMGKAGTRQVEGTEASIGVVGTMNTGVIFGFKSDPA